MTVSWTLHVDVAIVGAGPAGCLAAAGALAADPNLEVAVIERTPEGRHRIGEALLTGTVMTLVDAGLADEVGAAGFHYKVGAAYVWGETRDPWYVNYPEADGDWPAAFAGDGRRRSIHVPRHVYDPLLAEIVARRGVRFVRAAAEAVETRVGPAGPEVTSIRLGDGARVVAREYVDCTGQGSFLGRRMTAREPVGSPRTARYGYTRSVDWEQAVRAGFDPHRTNIVSGPGGWFWCIHLGEAGDGLTSFGFVSTPDVISRLTLANCAEAFPEAALFGFDRGYPEPRTFDGKPLDRLYGHPDYSYVCADLHGSNWSLAGDAALFIDPILSQGVTLAGHYGFLRGKAAAARIDGVEGAHAGVDLYYRREASVMREVVGAWYANNRSVEDWRLRTVAQARDLYGEEMTAEKAFRWITNLENIRDEYDPYPATERRHIERMLGAGTGA